MKTVKSITEMLKQDDLITSKLEVYTEPNITDPTIYTDILNAIPEINNKIRLFCRSTSQTSRRLVTPIMMNAGNTPYRTLKQILAQIEDTKTKIISFLSEESDLKHEFINEVPSTINTESKKVSTVVQRYTKKHLSLFRKFPYLESTFRELHSLIEAYNEVLKNKNIPADWDKEDFEREEVKGNLGLGIRNAVRDFIQSGRISGSALELLEAHGVSPFEAVHVISRFFMAQSDSPYSYAEYNNFIDQTVELWKDHYLQALERLGLDNQYVEKASGKFKTDDVS